jgi:hypothetical protein
MKNFSEGKQLINPNSIRFHFSSRYHDTIFVTWNAPIEKLQPILDELNTKHQDITIKYNMGYEVQFLDVNVENRKGSLFSTVYRDPASTPLLLPYVIDHPRLYYRRWFQWALKRAVRYSTTLDDFNYERLHIELTLLTHGFSYDFIKHGITLFFTSNQAIMLRGCLSNDTYYTLRRRLISSIQTEKQSRKEKLLLKTNKQLINLFYLYDWGPRCQFNEKFKKLWSSLVVNDSNLHTKNLRLQLSTVHCYTLNALLTH